MEEREGGRERENTHHHADPDLFPAALLLHRFVEDDVEEDLFVHTHGAFLSAMLCYLPTARP